MVGNLGAGRVGCAVPEWMFGGRAWCPLGGYAAAHQMVIPRPCGSRTGHLPKMRR